MRSLLLSSEWASFIHSYFLQLLSSSSSSSPETTSSSSNNALVRLQNQFMVTSVLGGELIGIHPLGEAIYYRPYNEDYSNNNYIRSNHRCRNKEQHQTVDSRDDHTNDDDDNEDNYYNDDNDDERMNEKCTVQSIDITTKNASVITFLGEGII